LIPIRKKVVKKNLSLAFPQFDQTKIDRTAFECYQSLATTLIEILCMPILSEEDIEKYFKEIERKVKARLISKFCSRDLLWC